MECQAFDSLKKPVAGPNSLLHHMVGFYMYIYQVLPQPAESSIHKAFSEV